MDVSDHTNGSDAGVQTWLRFFADEKERAHWQRSFPDDPMPPREKPAHDRDRFLPEPPMPPPAWTPPDSDDPPFDETAPAAVDREIRIEKLKDEIAKAAGGDLHETKMADLPPAIEEAYLEQVRDIERDDWQRPMDELTARCIAPLPPAELTDEALPPRLWELLHNLACRGFYVLHTDHLSDRALYEILWKKGLREEAILPGRSRWLLLRHHRQLRPRGHGGFPPLLRKRKRARPPPRRIPRVHSTPARKATLLPRLATAEGAFLIPSRAKKRTEG